MSKVNSYSGNNLVRYDLLIFDRKDLSRMLSSIDLINEKQQTVPDRFVPEKEYFCSAKVRKETKTDGPKTEVKEYSEDGKFIKKTVTTVSADGLSEIKEEYNSKEELMKMTLITQDKDKKCKVAIEHWFHPEGEIGYLKSLGTPSLAFSGTIMSTFERPITVEKKTTHLEEQSLTIIESFGPDKKQIDKVQIKKDENGKTVSYYNSADHLYKSRTEGKSETVTRDYRENGQCEYVKIEPKDGSKVFILIKMTIM